jgi:hypothetical protein
VSLSIVLAGTRQVLVTLSWLAGVVKMAKFCEENEEL